MPRHLISLQPRHFLDGAAEANVKLPIKRALEVEGLWWSEISASLHCDTCRWREETND